MPGALTVETNTLMPPFGVVEAIMPNVCGPDEFLFWMQTHTDPLGPKFWRTAVLRECLPDPDGELMFIALSPVIQQQSRTALVRIAL